MLRAGQSREVSAPKPGGEEATAVTAGQELKAMSRQLQSKEAGGTAKQQVSLRKRTKQPSFVVHEPGRGAATRVQERGATRGPVSLGGASATSPGPCPPRDSAVWVAFLFELKS